MTAGLFARAPRLAVLGAVFVALLTTAGLTYAASSTLSAQPTTSPENTSELPPLIVPDVRQQAYVFAKGMLEQGGFAWRVEGAVRGYSANVVASQSPAPGSKLAAGGAPTIVLRLQRNAGYAQEGTPEDKSPYAGVPARRFGVVQPVKAKVKAKTKTVSTPAATKPKPTKTVAAATKPKVAAKKEASRAAAFVVPGAPKEPLDEMTLATRAKKLSAWVNAHPKRTPAALDHWLYQHNWIVSGAKFGWSHGAESLRTLVAVDKRVQALWGVGADSEAVARKALADVKALSK